MSTTDTTANRAKLRRSVTIAIGPGPFLSGYLSRCANSKMDMMDNQPAQHAIQVTIPVAAPTQGWWLCLEPVNAPNRRNARKDTIVMSSMRVIGGLAYLCFCASAVRYTAELDIKLRHH